MKKRIDVRFARSSDGMWTVFVGKRQLVRYLPDDELMLKTARQITIDDQTHFPTLAGAAEDLREWCREQDASEFLGNDKLPD